MSFSFSGSMRCTLGVLVILGILLGTCTPPCDTPQHWVLYVECTLEGRSCKKTSRGQASPRALQRTLWWLTLWRWILQALLVALGHDLHGGVAEDIACQVHDLSIDDDRQGGLRQAGPDIGRQFRAGHGTRIVPLAAVRQSDGYHDNSTFSRSTGPAESEPA